MLGCTLSPQRSLHVVTLPMIINTVCSISWIFQWQTALLQIPGSDFLLDSRSVTWLLCFFLNLFSSLTQFNNFRGPRGRRRQQGNDKTEIRRYAERNEMKTPPRQIQYLCVIWDYSGSEDSHGCQIKKTQGSHTNRKWDERRKWWKKSRRRGFVDVIWALQTDSNTEGQRDERATIISRKDKCSNVRTWETS